MTKNGFAQIFIIRQLPWADKFTDYLQKLANRVGQGHFRYGLPLKDKLYFTRLDMEVKAYKRTGNAEHLYNIGVYCALEIQAPEHPKFHFDNKVDSVTRRKYGA